MYFAAASKTSGSLLSNYLRQRAYVRADEKRFFPGFKLARALGGKKAGATARALNWITIMSIVTSPSVIRARARLTARPERRKKARDAFFAPRDDTGGRARR